MDFAVTVTTMLRRREAAGGQRLLMAYSVEKLGLGDVIEERGLMEPSQFNARGGACPR